jgi:mRNA interferase MazF
MRRGEIYYADLRPTMRSEINKRCPVLIVSNDANNRAASTVTLLPITSNVSLVDPFELLLAPRRALCPGLQRLESVLCAAARRPSAPAARATIYVG